MIKIKNNYFKVLYNFQMEKRLVKLQHLKCKNLDKLPINLKFN